MCPFCGKTYKRLKSHLPHCKAASPPPISHEAAQRSAQHQLSHKSSPQKLAGPQSKKSRTASAAGPQTAASAPPQLAGPASLPSSARMKKQKLSEQIKAALVPPSTEPQPPRPTTSKAKQKTVQGLLEAVGPQVRAPAKGARSAPEGPSPAQHVAKLGTVSDAPRPASQPTSNRGSSEKQATPAVSVTQNFRTNENIVKPRVRKTDLATTEREIGDLSVNMDSGNGPQSKIILQDVKAMLGRDRNSLKPSKPSILVQIHSSGASRASSPPSQAPPATGNQLVGTSSASASQPALPPGRLSSQVHRAMKGLSSESPPLGPFSRTKPSPVAVDALGSPDGPVKEAKPLEGRRQTCSDSRTEGEWLGGKKPLSKVKHLNPPVVCCRCSGAAASGPGEAEGPTRVAGVEDSHPAQRFSGNGAKR